MIAEVTRASLITEDSNKGRKVQVRTNNTFARFANGVYLSKSC